MISEATFSKKFTSFWNEILPNSKNYVRLINGGLLVPVYEPFDEADRKNNTALTNVLSFNILRLVFNKSLKIDEVAKADFYNSATFENLVSTGVEYLSRFNYGSKCTLPLNHKEKNNIYQLYRAMYSRYASSSKNIVVDPVFDGCGFINQSCGDLMVDDILVEIKSGERRFSVTDLRQVLVYLVLNHYSKSPKHISKIELFNPRMGISYTEDVETFSKNLSALCSQELFAEIQKFVVDNNFIEVFGT